MNFRSAHTQKDSFDKVLLYLVIILVSFGLLMVFESSSSFAQVVFSNKYKFVSQHIVWVVAGSIGALIFYKLNIESIKRITKPLFYLSLSILSVLALQYILSQLFHKPVETPFTKVTYGAYRWVVITDYIRFQPSDLAKLSFILYASMFLEKIVEGDKRKTLGFFIVTFITTGLIALEPDFGTASIFMGLAMVLYFVSGLPLLYLFTVFPVLIFLGGILSFSSEYRRQRLLTFFKPSVSNVMAEGYHITQVLIAIGSGGLFGLGFGESRQKYAYIPEVVSDSIFAVIAEEFGFIGSIILLALFLFLIFRGIKIAKRQKNPFRKYVAVGVTCWIGFQAFVNLFAMTHLIPLTGVPLPFISYGGSSMVFSLMGIGLLLNISKSSAH